MPTPLTNSTMAYGLSPFPRGDGMAWADVVAGGCHLEYYVRPRKSWGLSMASQWPPCLSHLSHIAGNECDAMHIERKRNGSEPVGSKRKKGTWFRRLSCRGRQPCSSLVPSGCYLQMLRLDLDPLSSFVRGILPVFVEGPPQMQTRGLAGHRPSSSAHFLGESCRQSHHYSITIRAFVTITPQLFREKAARIRRRRG